MKTSIFDMNFVLPPLVEMTQVSNSGGEGYENIYPTLCYLHPECCAT